MAEVKENTSLFCRFLNESDFDELHRTFLAAFSDYLVPFQLSERQLRDHILNNAVDLDLSVGCFTGDKMIGFTLNGFGMWQGRSTAYDAGTGVIPEFRRHGASRMMFEFMTPMLRERRVEQLLLEVITGNEKAVNLYRGMGFEVSRKLLVLRAAGPLKFARELPRDVAVREIAQPDWNLFRSFWDGQPPCGPSWQNSPDAVERTRSIRKILGAFVGDKCAGYIIFSIYIASINQLAVDKNYRRRGIASLLLSEMQNRTEKDKPVQVTNLDGSLTGTVQFLRNRGFEESLKQYEMIKLLSDAG